MIRKVLISLDGSSLAHEIVPCVQPLLSHTVAEILLVSNVKESECWSRECYLEQVKAYLTGQQVTTQILRGPVAASIAEAATHWGADLIAMSTHGHIGLARAMLGSVADRVLHLAGQPVFLARTGARVPNQIKQLLVPLDGSPLAEAALPYAHALAQQHDATLTLLLALPEVNTWEWGEMVHPGPIAESWKADVVAAARYYLDHLKAQVVDVPCTTVLAPGQAAQAILTVADEEKIDLLVMNTHGRSGYQRWRHGSIASQVLHEAKVPLLLVRGDRCG